MIFELVSENLTGLGGMMGTERTWTNWRKFFQTIKEAKEYAGEDFNKGPKSAASKDVKELKWHRSGAGYRTEDLGHVMYHVRPVVVEGKP